MPPSRTCEVLLYLSGNACQLNRSTQHFLEVYSREFEILMFFWAADLSAVLLCPDPLAYNRTSLTMLTLSISFCAHFSVHSGECLRSSCSLALASTTTARL